MKFRGTVAAAVSLSFTFLCTNFVFAQNTANNEILVYPPKKPPVTKKWYLPLEFGEGRFTTGVYSGLNRFSRRRVDADKLDPFADRPLPTRKRESSSFKPGTWNWRPGMKRPAFSYKYKIINLTKDAQGSYEGMPGDYRQNYRPIPHVRFGGTFAPIPPLMGDPTQHRRGWYIKKYAEKRPKKEQYNQYVMDIVNDKIDESYPSLEWVTYSWKHPHKGKYNLTEDKVRPRFGSYEAFSNYDSRFPAYEPKKRYEVIKIPVVPPIHKRSAEKEEPSEKAPKSIDLRSVPSKSEDVIRRLQSASSIMASALRTAKLRQEQKAESEISSSDYDSNEMLDSDKSISLSSVYESSGTNSSSSSSFIDSEELRKDMHPVGNDKGKKILLFNANGKQQQQEQKHNHYQQNIVANNMRYGRHKRSPPRKESVEKLAKKLYLAPKKEESRWTFKNMPEHAPEIPSLSIFRLEDQPDSFWDSIYGRTKEKSNDSSSDSDSDSTDEATMKPLITTMKVAPKVHPGIVLPQDKKKSFLHLMGKTEPSDPQKLKLEVPRDDADLKGKGAFRFPTFPPVPPRPYKQPTPYVQPTIPPRPPPQQPFVRFAAVHQDKIINAQHTENNIFHLQNSGRASPYVLADSVKARIVKDNVDHIKHDMLHVQNRGEDKQITGSRVDYTKRRENVIKDNSDRIQSDMNDIQNGVHHNGGKKDLFASIPHLHGNKELHRSFGLPAVRKRKLEHVLRFGDDRLYDPEEISENDKAVWSIGPPLNESEPVLNTEERNYVPEGAYQFPHFRNPNFDPETAYDEHGVPVFMHPNYTEPPTLKGDRIFGLGRGMQHARGQRHNHIARDLQTVADNTKNIKTSPNIVNHVQDSKPNIMKQWAMMRQKRSAYGADQSDEYGGHSEPHYNHPPPSQQSRKYHHNDWVRMQYTHKPYMRRFLQNRASDDHKVEQAVHKQSGKAVHPGVMNKVEDVRKHMVMKRHAIYSAYRDDHPYSRHRMGLYMPRPGDIRYLSQGLTVPPYQMGRSSKTTMNIAPKDYENGIIFKRSLDDRASDNLSVSKNSASSKDEDVASSNVKSGVGGIDIKDEDVLSEVKDISGIDDYDAGNITANATTTISPKNLTTIFSGYKYWTLAVTYIFNTKPFRGTIEPPEFPVKRYTWSGSVEHEPIWISRTRSPDYMDFYRTTTELVLSEKDLPRSTRRWRFRATEPESFEITPWRLNKRRARNRTTLPPWVSQETSYERWKRIGIEEETEKRKRLNDEWEEKRKDYIRMKLERKQHGQTRKKIVVQEIFRDDDDD